MRPGRALVLAMLVACLAACGGTAHPPSVASLGTASSTKSATSSSKSSSSSVPRGGSFVKFVSCMRAHGIQAQVGPDGQGVSISAGGIDPSSPQFRQAQTTCQKLLPGGGPKPLTPAQQQKVLQRLVKLARCMRSHGVPSFPDPTVSGKGVLVNKVPAASTPQFERAAKACGAAGPNGGFAVRVRP